MTKLRLKFFSGDIDYLRYGGIWITPKQNNGDFDYWIVVELVNLRDACGDNAQDKYSVTSAAIAPSQISEEQLKSALNCVGMENEDPKTLTDEQKIYAVYTYGISATLSSKTGNNARELLKEARKELQVEVCLFGFYMDRPANRIGHTGWDAIKGDLSLETAEKNIKEWGIK